MCPQYHNHHDGPETESLRLEAVTTCVGFDDMLDETLAANHPHLDTMIVVTSHADRKTQGVARKHGAICVQTDLFGKNGRRFNKGAAINAGFARFQYVGWRMHLDADIALPPNFRRMAFNHTHLDRDCIYGADRVNVLGRHGLKGAMGHQQHIHGSLLNTIPSPIESRFVHTLHGYVPLGFFQMWHGRNQHSYPYSLGTAEHDDVLFSMQWPESQRRHLPTAVVYQLTARPTTWGENWDGHRKHPRLK